MEAIAIEEILKWGIGGVCIAAIFWKFLPELFKFLERNRDEPKGYGSGERERHDNNWHESQWRVQEHLNTSISQRLDGVAKDVRRLRDGHGEIKTSLAVALDNLQTIKEAVKDDDHG